ncbi:NrdH-redoxin [Mycolicibacter terrae]|jgi:mycoredoxin|uniref:NrdH-redoxin n=1 Tax=Mycolicibacter terrae TaxID=1788 RepID=A0AAD1HVB6_9MYCO|nr:mycoredoxin [Mycolicibacter terrae]ORW89351.1 NrdH-redoxin [Mycolicibacter terrae]BBX21804.1 NrdH-redoxin [Mycolicibacter terrae]SNV85507.1 glutaredoxin protein [Mycolicibacter terrae]
MTVSDPPLIMYTTQWCGYCRQLKKALEKFEIGYDEINIEQDPTAAKFVETVNGGNRTVPTLRFADGSTMTNPTGREVKAKLDQLGG